MSHAAVAFHDRLARSWEARYEKQSFNIRRDAVAACLDGQDLDSTRWLDAGCGTGTLSRFLAKRGCNVLGVDASASMVLVARELAAQDAASNAPAFEQVETVERLPFLASAFDGVLCSSVLEYLNQPRHCLEEFRRVLKPDGLLLVSVPNAHSWLRRGQKAALGVTRLIGHPWPDYLLHSRNDYSGVAFTRLLRELGFVVSEVQRYGGPRLRWPVPRAWNGSLLLFSSRKCDAAEPAGTSSKKR